LGLFTCTILSIIAIVIGKPGKPGRILGIVGVILHLIGTIITVLIIAMAAREQSSQRHEYRPPPPSKRYNIKVIGSASPTPRNITDIIGRCNPSEFMWNS